jgi:hypothetical protein
MAARRPATPENTFPPLRPKRATRATVSTFGALAGLAGIEHGAGEVLQGNVAPDGVMVLSWPGSELYDILAGEPAMTTVPNLLATGILAILVSLVFLVWATMFVRRRHGGPILVLLSGVMLLVGAADLVARGASLYRLTTPPGEPVAVVLRRRGDRLAVVVARHGPPRLLLRGERSGCHRCHPLVYHALRLRVAPVDDLCGV